MGEVNPDNFRSEYWIERLRSYADAVIKCFEWNLAAINGPGMGIPLEAKLRCSLQIDPHSMSDQNNRRLDENERIARRDDPLLRSLEDMTFFDAWLNQPPLQAKRLLLLAPFGSGKSVMLAKFALVLAKRLKEWCDPTGKSAPPLVPFPVRLRGWGGRGRLWGYMIGGAKNDAQTDVLGQTLLSAEDIKQLRDHGSLLPILDGFDELPNGVSDDEHDGRPPRAQLVDEMLAEPPFRTRMILASRPGHGAENGPYAERATIHELGELHQDKAESFIRERLADLNSSALEERIKRYRKAQPTINDLFRRPLFLTAWCAKAILPGVVKNIPTNISGLMDILLKHVFDARLAAYSAGNGLPSTEELLGNRHLLGAVLAIHAEEGFAIPLRDSAEKNSKNIHWNIIADEACYKRCVQSAIKAGLLIRDPDGTYTHKIPIVEYLIGCYYAWLAQPESETNLERPRQLLGLFQRRFWWKDYEEIWLYAFDEMWHGNEPQWQWARALVEWILNLSNACVSNANWDGPLLEGHTAHDREPYSCDAFALQVLLPMDDITAPANHHIEELIQLAEKQLKARWEQVWCFLEGGVGPTLVRLAQRRPRIVWETLLDFLSNNRYELHWVQIVGDIERTARYWDSSAIDQLLKRVLLTKSKQGLMYRCILNVLQWYDYMDQLLEYLAKPECVDTWSDIAYAIYHCSTNIQISQMGTSQLLEYLTEPEYKDTWEYIALTINRKNVTPISSADVESLFGCLAKPEYSDAWGGIARIIGKSSLQDGPTVMDRLLECLIDTNYEEAWWAIRFGIYEASVQVGPPVVDRLLDYLSKPEFEHAWSAIAFAICDVCLQFDSTGVDRLAGFLIRPEYIHVSEDIIEALHSVYRPMGPTTVDLLLQFLKHPQYKHVWKGIVLLVSRSALLSPATVDQLFGYLTNAEYKDVWAGISSLIVSDSTKMGPASVNRLLDCYEQLEYKPARHAIARAVSSASVGGGSVELDRLLEYMAEAEYADIWEVILRTVGKASAQIGPAILNRLLDFFERPQYEKVRRDILYVIDKVSAQIDSAVLKRLLGCLADPTYHKVWPSIANAIEKSLEQVVPSTAELLFEYLSKPEYEQTWATLTIIVSRLPANNKNLRLIDALVQSGRISSAIRLAGATTDLLCFVRDVNPEAKPGLKIIYGVATRHDADLLLNIRFAPAEIRTLLEIDRPVDVKRSEIENLEQDDFVDEIEKLVKCLGRNKMVEFRQAWSVITKTTKTVRYKQMIRLLLRPLTRAQRDQFCWKAKERGSKAASDMSRERSSLRIHAGMLTEILEGEDKKELAKRLLDLVIGCDPFVPSWLDYIAASHDCPACGAVHPVDDGDSSDGTPPRHCRACNARMPETMPTESPTDLLHCQSQHNPPLSFLRVPPETDWDCIPRRDNYCPCIACSEKHKKLFDPKSNR